MRNPTDKALLTTPGHFLIGCNYWASHAGTRMWSDWQSRVVEADLRKLAAGGLQVLRVFPLWSDFQPIQLLRTAWSPVEYRFGVFDARMGGEPPLGDDEASRAGVSDDMMRPFEQFARLAEKYGLRLVVALVTGWMSGRLYVPPALEGRNALTDPLAVQWGGALRELLRAADARLARHRRVGTWQRV